jgi:hypothetical protein
LSKKYEKISKKYDSLKSDQAAAYIIIKEVPASALADILRSGSVRDL